PTKKTKTTAIDMSLTNESQPTLEFMILSPEINKTNIGNDNINSHSILQTHMKINNNTTLLKTKQIANLQRLILQLNKASDNNIQSKDKDIDLKSNVIIESQPKISYSKAVKKNIFASIKKKNKTSIVWANTVTNKLAKIYQMDFNSQ
ncbi:14409_t:CDS:2, partial [Dentiscutata erythropus]